MFYTKVDAHYDQVAMMLLLEVDNTCGVRHAVVAKFFLVQIMGQYSEENTLSLEIPNSF